jgi:hypothetical protein
VGAVVDDGEVDTADGETGTTIDHDAAPLQAIIA